MAKYPKFLIVFVLGTLFLQGNGLLNRHLHKARIVGMGLCKGSVSVYRVV